MRCLPIISIVRNIFSSAPTRPNVPAKEQRGAAKSASTDLLDTLYKDLDRVKPYSKPARADVAKVKKALGKQLEPKGEPLTFPGHLEGGVNGYRTGFDMVFKYPDQDAYSLALPNQQTVVRSRSEIETHLLIQSHLKSRYGDPAIRAEETLRLEQGGRHKRFSLQSLLQFRRQGGADRDETAPLLEHVTSSDVSGSDRSSRTASQPLPYEGPSASEVGEGKKTVSRKSSTDEQKVVDFYTGNQKSGLVACACDVLRFSHDELESNHKFIQYLFPTDTASAFNQSAPVLDGDAFLALRDHPAVSEGIDAGLEKMLQFYGLEMREGKLQSHPEQQARIQQWLHPGSHHCLRMTRILRSLSLFGKSAQAISLFAVLQEAVNRMPAATSAEMRYPLKHWRNALTEPVRLSASKSPCTALLFPNKYLLAMQTPSQASLSGAPVKAALFEKQEAISANLAPEHTKAPLVAHFSKPEFAAKYDACKHLDECVRDSAQECKVDVCAEYYFADISDASTARSTSGKAADTVYKVHVDFANKAFGGAWRQAHGYAQEEIAFIENTGLAAVAQHAGSMAQNPDEETILLDPKSRFGAAFSTRVHEKPSPILVEGCVRAAQFGSYGKAAARLSKHQAVNALEPARPQTTNWLAIAAPDLRPPADQRISRSMQFMDIFNTAHAGFSMTKCIGSGRKVEIHTGQLGCGVFRNDVTLSTAAQMLAAKLARVDRVQFHGYRSDARSVEEFRLIKATIESCIATSLATLPRESIGSLATRTFEAIEANL